MAGNRADRAVTDGEVRGRRPAVAFGVGEGIEGHRRLAHVGLDRVGQQVPVGIAIVEHTLRGAGRLLLQPVDDERRIEGAALIIRSEEHTSELQSLMRNSYAVFCLKKNTYKPQTRTYTH